MKKLYILLVVSVLFLITCKKIPELKIYNLEISEESVMTTTCDATITAKYSFPTEIYDIKVLVNASEDMNNAALVDAALENNVLNATISNLIPSTNYYYCFRYSNGINLVDTDTKTFKTQDASLPTVTTKEVVDITLNTATSGGNVTSDGGIAVTARGTCWNTEHNPTINNSHTSDGSGTGDYTSSLTDLTANTTYYVRAYAVNDVGVAYGNETSFTTQNTSLPSVTTNGVSDITMTTAITGGNVISDGWESITARGVCWSSEHNPTISNSHTTDGDGTGEFISSLTGLTQNTTYYVKAYAVNTVGVAYGDEISFTTIAEPTAPTVNTIQVTNITPTSARIEGNVTSSGGADVTERGVCWGTNQNPTISGNHSSSGSGTGSFVVDITGLTENTTYYARAYAKNSVGTAYGDAISFTTSSAPTVPTVTTNNITNITQNSATGGGKVVATGGANVSQRGICWSTSQNPTTSNSHASSGIGTGNFTCNMTNLSSNTTYYVRAYAVNSVGTAYGEQKSFTTGSNVSSPTVTTNNVSNITTTTAACGGNVTSAGNGTVSARGVCWSTSSNPTISNNHTTNGTGTGTYTSSLTGLTPNTTYYVRAYATNEAGTAYGAQKTFTTNADATTPTVTTSNVSDITTTTATCGGNVTSAGNGTVSARGVCWSTSQNPTISNSHTTNGTGTGTFTSSLTGLTPNTVYYIRAYATNEAGTAYGSQKTFTTLSNVTIPTVSTNNVTDITTTTATCGGNVTSDGGAIVTARGVCWGTASNPTISNSHTTNGSGTGTFTSSLTGLTPNTTYYVRAYATNEAGTSYGSQKTFTTNSEQPQAPTGAINGLFSVSATQQVYFSQGNLQYKASTNTWLFADNQWNYVGEENSNISSSYSGWIDLFGWGTGNNPTNSSTNNGDYGTFNDWGNNAINNGGNTANVWRTLTHNEWMYVFNTRSTSSGIRYAKAKVNGVNGVILLPDNWNSSNYSLSNFNSSEASFNSNTVTLSDWNTKFEVNGAVFLPAAGKRYGTDVNNVGSNGYYWSATDKNSDYACSVSINNGNLVGLWIERRDGLSVRLVQNY